MSTFLRSHSPRPLLSPPYSSHPSIPLSIAIITSTCPPHPHRDIIHYILSSRARSLPNSSTLSVLSPCQPPPAFSSHTPRSLYIRIPSSPTAAAEIINTLRLHVSPSIPLFLIRSSSPQHTQVLLDLDAYTNVHSIETTIAYLETFTTKVVNANPSPFVASAIAWAAPAAQ